MKYTFFAILLLFVSCAETNSNKYPPRYITGKADAESYITTKWPSAKPYWLSINEKGIRINVISAVINETDLTSVYLTYLFKNNKWSLIDSHYLDEILNQSGGPLKSIELDSENKVVSYFGKVMLMHSFPIDEEREYIKHLTK